MKDSRLLYDAFTIYYERGMNALGEKNYDVAQRNLYAASETLLKLAKESTGQLRTQRINRAEEIAKFADQINERKVKVVSKNNYNNNNNNDSSNNNESNSEETPINIVLNDNEDITLEEAIDNLNNLIGLNGVKQQVSDLIDQIKVFQQREALGLPNPEMSHHMVFIGNPGTGKTTVARIIGQIYKALGLLSKGHLVEVDRSNLVASYVGQTAPKTKDVINTAKGGVLFIDEAYTLKKSDGNDFGQEAIDTLNKDMEDSRNDLVVIAAGYEENMEEFLKANKGLKSRFRTTIKFDDYSADELYEIFLGLLRKNKYTVSETANNAIYNHLTANKFSGNGRDIRNLFEDIVKLHSRRVANLKNPTREDLTTISIEDLPFTLNGKNEQKKVERKNKPISNEPKSPESKYLANNPADYALEYKFDWDSLPSITFDDIAGLDQAKEAVQTKVLLPLEHPEAFDGYIKKNGGGLFLYGPPGTGKTMIAAAIANEIGAKFCSVKPSDLLHQGAGNTEKAVRSLFAQARQHPCSIIYFDEMDSIAQKNTKSSYSRQLRSELLAQIQGTESYGSDNGNILFLIAATNKPWDVDSAFVRPGRFGTAIYVGLPDVNARAYIVNNRFEKTRLKGIVEIKDDVFVEEIVEKTDGFNGSDITNLLDRIDEISAVRGVKTGEKYICRDDVLKAFEEVHSSVQAEDIEKLNAWKMQNGF